MCYEALVNGDAAAESLPTVRRAERWDALVNGFEAAALVILVLVWQGAGLPTTMAAAGGAVLLGYLLHQAVLLAGVGLVRARRRRLAASPV